MTFLLSLYGAHCATDVPDKQTNLSQSYFTMVVSSAFISPRVLEICVLQVYYTFWNYFFLLIFNPLSWQASTTLWSTFIFSSSLFPVDAINKHTSCCKIFKTLTEIYNVFFPSRSSFEALEVNHCLPKGSSEIFLEMYSRFSIRLWKPLPSISLYWLLTAWVQFCLRSWSMLATILQSISNAKASHSCCRQEKRAAQCWLVLRDPINH